MTTSNDSLNFFILEAGECLERLDANLATAGPSGPDAVEFVRQARTLRGAALMHRLAGMAGVAAGVERVGRSLRDGSARWSPAVAAALVAAVDDLKILLHNLRIWGPNEEARAARRLADLTRVVPATEDRPSTPAAPLASAAGHSIAFLAREATETATALDAIGDPTTESAVALETAWGHVRTLRGVAAVHDAPPIPDVLDALDRAARGVDATHGVLSPAHASLFAAAAALLRRTAYDLRSTGRSETGTPEEQQFQVARDALSANAADADRIVPISALFYGDEQGGVVSRAPSPPTTPADRFRLEVVSLAEHLRGLVREAQGAGPGPISDRTIAELRTALGAVLSAAQSFGERDVADFLATFTEGHPVFDFLTLNAIDDLVALVTQPTATAAGLSERMAELAKGRALDDGIAEGFRSHIDRGAADRGPVDPGPADRGLVDTTPVARPALRPAPSPAPPARRSTRDRMRTPTGSDLQALLADGIAGFSTLGDLPLIDETDVAPARPAAPREAAPPATPAPPAAPAAEPTVVPIESLLYRGDTALARARALRDALRANGGTPPEALAELYDLLDLAAPS